MATFATGGFHGTRYIKETEFGVTPDNPQMKNLRHTSNSLILSKDSFQSAELRSDAQISDLRHGNRQAAGDIGIELSFLEFDDFLAAAIRSEWVDDLDGNRYLVAGVDMSSFTIERAFTDIQQYETFTGCEVSTLAITIGTNAIVTGSIGFVGKNIGFSQTPLDATPTPSQTYSPFDGFRGSILEGGTPIAVVTTIELNIDNAIEPAFVIGADTANALIAGRINVTGTLTAYFENIDLLAKFADEVESSIVLTLGDGVSKSYTITLPRIKYTGGDNPVDGEGAITLTMPFQALYDECTGTNIRIDSIAGPADANCELTYASTVFNESSTTPGAIDNTILVDISGGSQTKTFTGVIGSPMAGFSMTNVPAGLVAQAIKVTNTQARVELTGTADADITTTVNLTATFAEAALQFGFCHCPGGTLENATMAMTIEPAA